MPLAARQAESSLQKKIANATLVSRRGLDAAYRATRYVAGWAAGDGVPREICLRIGAPCPLLDAWLDTVGARCWSYLTAVNPASQPLPARDNAARLASLEERLTAGGHAFLRGAAIADAGDWPDEPSLLVAGLDRQAAEQLAATYGQWAFLWGERGGLAELCWTPDAQQSG